MEQLQRLGSQGFTDTTYGDYCWLASRRVDITEDTAAFCTRSIDSAGLRTSHVLWRVFSDDEKKHYDPERAFRPVFYINSNVKITSGEGTVDSPYNLSEN